MKNISLVLVIAVFFVVGCTATHEPASTVPTQTVAPDAVITQIVETQAVIVPTSISPAPLTDTPQPTVRTVDVGTILGKVDLCASAYTAFTAANVLNTAEQLKHLQETVEDNKLQIYKSLISNQGTGGLIYFFQGNLADGFVRKQRLIVAMYVECKMSGTILSMLSATDIP